MNKNHRPDFLVIGAGALGLASAEALLLQGASVTLLERGEVGRQASWAGGGILSPLCPWDYPLAVTQLALRGAGMFEAWAANLQQNTGIDPEYQRCGMQILPPLELAKVRQWCASNPINIVYNQVDSQESVFLPDVAQVRNPRLLQALKARVLQLGGNIIEQCEVREWQFERNEVTGLRSSQGELQAANFLLTAGTWSQVLLGQQALKLDIKPIRGQMLLFKFPVPPLQSIVLKQDLYLIPRRDGHLLVGSTLEDVGFDSTTTAAARDYLWQAAAQVLPALRDMPLVQHWAGLRPASPQNIPTIGRHAQFSNLYLNSGHFRYGVTMALASVEILLNEINRLEQPFDVSAYGWR